MPKTKDFHKVDILDSINSLVKCAKANKKRRGGTIGLKPQQYEQLHQILKTMPQTSKSDFDTLDDVTKHMDHNFAGMTLYSHASGSVHGWILDFGAIYRMA